MIFLSIIFGIFHVSLGSPVRVAPILSSALALSTLTSPIDSFTPIINSLAHTSSLASSSKAYHGRGPNNPPPIGKFFYDTASEHESSSSTYTLEHSTQSVGPPLEESSDIIDQLAREEDDFLYLKVSETLQSLIQALPGPKVDTEEVRGKTVFAKSETAFLTYLRELLQTPGMEIDPIGPMTSPIAYFDTKGDKTSHFKPSPIFHKDPIFSDAKFRLNVWIATADVKGHPLAFCASDSLSADSIIERKYSSILKSPDDLDCTKYTFVRDMKAWEMLVFKGTDVFHGVPFLVDEDMQGDRECVVATFGYLDL
jgi:hypothetical protein